MTVKYFGGTLPEERQSGEYDGELIALAEATPGEVEALMDKLDFSKALEAIWKLVSRTNKYIDETQPWVLCKDEATKARLAAVMYNLTESLRIITVLISAFMPDTGARMAEELKIPESALTWESTKEFGGYPSGMTVERCEPLFPRIEVE